MIISGANKKDNLEVLNNNLDIKNLEIRNFSLDDDCSLISKAKNIENLTIKDSYIDYKKFYNAICSLKKLNKLTSLCYPQYKEDDNFNKKTRMKPPLVQFRMGELFGNSTKGMLGFIKSISYTYPDESPWETKPVTVEGKMEERRKVQYGRVPKYIMASIGFQVIHEEVPNLDTEFYGIVARQKAMEEKEEQRFNGGVS